MSGVEKADSVDVLVGFRGETFAIERVKCDVRRFLCSSRNGCAEASQRMLARANPLRLVSAAAAAIASRAAHELGHIVATPGTIGWPVVTASSEPSQQSQMPSRTCESGMERWLTRPCTSAMASRVHSKRAIASPTPVLPWPGAFLMLVNCGGTTPAHADVRVSSEPSAQSQKSSFTREDATYTAALPPAVTHLSN